jgi:C1A family cysteine protease
MSKFTPPGLGWLRDLPDPRDLTPEHDAVVRLLHGLSPAGDRPSQLDLREFCGEIYDQFPLAAGSVHACLAQVQYFERRTRGRTVEPSRLFLYRTARRLLGWTGDAGLPLRTALQAMVKFGLPPERFWPYEQPALDVEPDAFVYASADRWPGTQFIRLDGRASRPENTLETVKRFLAAGFAVVFGFPVLTSVSIDAEIPVPTIYDGVRGGQAALAVGYDDTRRIRSDRGALLFANSWGPQWGDQGYGWLPYAYVREQLAVDFWTLLMPEWLASGELRRPGS